MTENELGKALLKVDLTRTPAAHDPRALSDKTLELDRRRIRLLVGLTSLFWILTATGIVWLVCGYFVIVEPRLRAYAAGRAQLQNDWNDWAWAGALAARSVLACIMALLLAAVCTVLLILHSRRATLRQINANLRQISERLKSLSSD